MITALTITGGFGGSLTANSFPSGPEMTELIKKELRELGASFVNAELAAGGRLSRAVFAALGPVHNSFAPLPSGIEPASLKNLEWTIDGSRIASLAWLASEIGKAFPDRPNQYVLVEDPWALPTDLRADDHEQRFPVLEEDSIVFGLSNKELNAPNLQRLVRHVISFTFNGFVIDLSALPNPFEQKIAVAELANHVKLVFVSAFDQEGLIVADWG